MNLTPTARDGTVPEWRERLHLIVETMREMSAQTDPQEMRRAYAERVRRIIPTDATLSLSRRELAFPWYRVTRSTLWKKDINPWKEKELLPLLRGGVLAELLYADEPRFFDDLAVPDDDPAAEYLSGYRSFLVVPQYDRGDALNWVVLMKREPGAFRRDQFPEIVWMTNLFGRVTYSLVLAEQLKAAYEAVDQEMRVVADIQRSLLPAAAPCIPTIAIAAHYQTSHRAGGDYYDYFPLPGGRWGMLIADVSGHGTPAAVLMAITHSLAHSYGGPPTPPGELLGHLNHHLCGHYTSRSDTFVTAFYGIYDPADRSLNYASAGHNPPRLKRCQDGSLALLNAVRGLPLGVFPGEPYREAVHHLVPGDQLVLYTDGITEAQNAAGEMFGLARLDKVLENCSVGAPDLLRSVVSAVDEFCGGLSPHDDRTLLVAKVT